MNLGVKTLQLARPPGTCGQAAGKHSPTTYRPRAPCWVVSLQQPTKQKGANIFLGDSDKRGGEGEGENKISFLFIYFWPCWVCCCKVFPPAVASGGCTRVAALRFLSAAASLAAEHRL